ncbi:MAG: damage-inducible protein DinB [Flavobacterium sp.]|uniref:DinB family protein n=1 Tax=Flavobacterium sp. TaxID=239 RepID=UPI001228591D|nr:DinB family protein [Flavobacterium sp.]RZJ64237.1 MAG: damage-inducible protein DinB [Flavobacterium sp.]
MATTLTTAFLEELKMETISTRKCLERIPESTFGFKPHPKSMEMGYLVQLVAAIPSWITHMIKDSEIDFATFPQPKIETTSDIMTYFEANIKEAEETLRNTTDEDLEGDFSLKRNGEVLYTTQKKVDIGTTLNHWVHHRGQLTVYMRLNDILVPSIYGPSADEKGF